MIIGSLFDGDDMRLAGLQHDVYDQALACIVRQCNSVTLFARRLLNDTSYEQWGHIVSFDHRDLQNIQDYVAAAWRFQQAPNGPTLPFSESDLNLSPDDWLRWLLDEVSNWDPENVRCVQIVLTHPSDEIRVAAETQLILRLLQTYFNVPWHSDVYGFWQDSLDRYPAELLNIEFVAAPSSNDDAKRELA